MINKLKQMYIHWRCKHLLRAIYQLDKEIEELKYVRAVAFQRYAEHHEREKQLAKN